MPEHCPACGTKRVRGDDEVAYYCPNVSCPGRRLEGLVHFASRGAMDIRGLSYARISQLIEAGLVRDVADLYSLRVDQLVGLERYAQKSAQSLVEAIQESKRRPLANLIFGLGIRHVGATAAEVLARHFGSMDALLGSTEAEIAAVHGIGDVIARSVVEYFAEPAVRDLVDRLRVMQLTLEQPRSASAGSALRGMTIVITGTLPTLSRQQAIELVEQHGGRVTDSVSKKTSFLVAGEGAGSKLAKAQALGVEILDEAGLLRRIAP
jgi:DNA ligase (NAD+)